MADPTPSVPGDDVLTAYLDGELDAAARAALDAQLAADPALKARLDGLAASNRSYKEAFALVLGAAPGERLTAMVGQTALPAEPTAPRRVWVAIAAAVVLFAAGIAIGVVSRPAAPVQTATTETVAPPNWRQVVAEYMALTTPATLAALPDNPSLPAAVAAYAPALKLDVSADKLMLPMDALKDVRLYDLRGRPLIEAAYLSSDAMTVAFCIILNGQPDAPLAFEQREGQNIVFWTMGGHGYMVASTAPRAQLETLAKNLQARFST